VSDSDSFITEVTEEVRRDQLFGYVRKYGWIAVLCVVVLVGGAAWNEYNKAQTTKAAQATGDALLSALQLDEPASRAAAVAEIAGEGPTAAITALMTAGLHVEAGDIEASSAIRAQPLRSSVRLIRTLVSHRACASVCKR